MSEAAARIALASAEPAREVGPPLLLVTMGASRVAAIRVSLLSLTRHETAAGEGFGALALALPNGQALYIEQDAVTLRELGAACMDCANRLDGGKARQ